MPISGVSSISNRSSVYLSPIGKYSGERLSPVDPVRASLSTSVEEGKNQRNQTIEKIRSREASFADPYQAKLPEALQNHQNPSSNSGTSLKLQKAMGQYGVEAVMDLLSLSKWINTSSSITQNLHRFV